MRHLCSTHLFAKIANLFTINLRLQRLVVLIVDKLTDTIGLDGYLEHVLELRIGREQNVGLKVDDVLLLVGAESEILVDLSVHYICLQNYANIYNYSNTTHNIQMHTYHLLLTSITNHQPIIPNKHHYVKSVLR